MLASALDDAWDLFEKTGSRFARSAYSRAMREVVAKRIIKMAQRGVRGQEQLAADAVKFISANYVESYSAKIESRKDRAVELKPNDTVSDLSAWCLAGYLHVHATSGAVTGDASATSVRLFAMK